ncbi:lipid kinase [Xanthobacter tagetidis]|uniref:Lipid kinase n=1 Tax=Xanthobacter tagetidis TaxID=60216 RepID=A0A3L7APK5_9HYPH|nr:YegS/Rv2252/BmrU family lipid kinase [Xanthobacter tagetidis]RLP81530.1 lipid kinase [Xanthobacter tagetidis]
MSLSPSPRRALLLVNPRARMGRTPLARERAALEAGGIDVAAQAWPQTGTLSDLIRREAAGFDLAVIGGGDGTLNGAAAALADTGLPLGVLPLGTANDFARTLGIPQDTVAAARLIATGTPRAVDLGDVNGHPFLNVASIGFSADLARALTHDAKRRYGVLGYAVVAARLLAQSRLFTAHVVHDGTVEKVRTLQVSVGNGRYYGGGMAVASDATAEDGRLDFYSLEVDHWWRLLGLLPALRRGTQGRWRDVRAFRTTEVTVETRRPRPVNTDGELVTHTPARFSIRPRALRVYARTAAAAPVEPFADTRFIRS